MDGIARHGRLTVNINVVTKAALDELGSDGTTATEVIRRAVALLKLVDDRRREGETLVFVSEDGRQQARLELLY